MKREEACRKAGMTRDKGCKKRERRKAREKEESEGMRQGLHIQEKAS